MKVFSVGILKATEVKSRIRLKTSRIRGGGNTNHKSSVCWYASMQVKILSVRCVMSGTLIFSIEARLK
jgi:hypothetical protein